MSVDIGYVVATIGLAMVAVNMRQRKWLLAIAWTIAIVSNIVAAIKR